MTNKQVIEAIRQMCTHCDLKMATYEPISARGTLYELGFSDEETEQVLQHLHDTGFSYCLDSRYGNKASQGTCYWGPDQLKSRLEFVL